jgi:hypothetical protein
MPQKVDVPSIKSLTGTITIVSVIVIAFYATGLYRNVLQIEKLKNEKKQR